MAGRSQCIRLCAVQLLALTLVACGSSTRRDSGPTLSAIESVAMPALSRELPKTTMEQVLEQYQAVLEVTPDSEIRIQVQRRLAGLEMAQGESRQADGVQSERYFSEAVVLYQALLDAHPERADNDRLLYQMAKAYELDGEIELSRELLGRLAADYPESEYYPEARFRHGEMLFSQQRYIEAESAYRAVIAFGTDSPYFRNAVYMQGWSLFKQSRYDEALEPFTRVLELSIPADGDVEALPRARQDMVQDSLRAMSLAFYYLEGADSLAAYSPRGGETRYTHRLYSQLANLYLAKERYRDSAATFARYVEDYPGSDYAPGFSVKLIAVYQQGNFPSEIIPAKQDFVRSYGIHSKYWEQRDEVARTGLRPHLYVYIEELAAHFHASAQLLQADYNAAASKAKKSVPQKEQAQVRDAYLTAGNWYAEFTASFPDDSKTPGMVFLMAESLYEAGELVRAINAYERVAYDYKDPVNGADAGYSALLGYGLQASKVAPDVRADWQLEEVESKLRFSEVYPQDPRALPVLTSAAEQLLSSDRAREAIAAASRVTSWQPTASQAQLHTAWLVQGHGHFQLADYVAAERAYSGALLAQADDAESRAAIVDRMAASIYKQAEAHLVEADNTQAVDDFLRVASAAPGTSIAIKAHYEGANQLMAGEHWDRAALEWERFRSAYPQHELADSVPAKLAHIHQQQGNWREAADELSIIALTDSDAGVRRQSQYLAAELYEKDGATALAITQYQGFVEKWPAAFDLGMEARFRISELYEEEGEAGQRRVWLRHMMNSHDRAGTRANDRSRYLAAMSAAVFAEDAYKGFRAAPLSQPLKRSFKTKKKLMKATLTACDRVLAYGVAEFVTQASFHIGDVYASLSQDLMESERPGGLDALEMEQYELLLEEQAYPFEEQAIEIHQANARRSWSGVYDPWVRNSIDTLGKLLPARYGKSEQLVRYSDGIH